MKTSIAVIVALLSAPAWADEPAFKCSTMVYVFNDPKMHPMIKGRISQEVHSLWQRLTGRDMDKLDEVYTFLACLQSPNATVEEAEQAAFRSMTVASQLATR